MAVDPVVIELQAKDNTGTALDSVSRKMERQKRVIDSHIETMKRQDKFYHLLEKDAEDYKLAVMGASQAQRDAARTLRESIKAQEQATRSGKGLNGQMRMMRGGFGQLGHQVQDVAVQLQGGTDAMIVFGQQGGQIASIFGGKGAVLGAFLAVGAALVTIFRNTEVADNKLAELRQTLEDLVPASNEAAKAIEGALSSITAAEYADTKKDVDKLVESMKNQVAGALAAEQAMTDLESGTKRVRGGVIQTNKAIDHQKDLFQDLAGEAGKNSGQLLVYIQALEQLGVQARTPEIDELIRQVSELGDRALATAPQLEEAMFTPEDVVKAGQNIEKMRKKFLDEKEKIQNTFEENRDQIIADYAVMGRAGSDEEQAMLDRNIAARDEALNKIAEREANADEAKKTRLQNELDREKKLMQRKQASHDKALDQLKAFTAADETEADRINKRYDAQLLRAEQLSNQLLDENIAYSDASIAIEKNRQAALDRLRDSQLEKHLEMVTKMRDATMAMTRSSLEAEIAGIEEKYRRAREAREKDVINQQEFDAIEMQLERDKTEALLNEKLKLVGGFENIEDSATKAMHAFITGAENGTEALQMFGRAIVDEVIKSLIQMGIEKVKQSIISDQIQAGSLAKSVAANTLAMKTIAAASAPAASLVSLATSGGNAVGAAAGISSTTALAASVASFEGGGFTGLGARSGGVDGKGGFPAILHPNETVVDHTKGGRGSVTVINNIDASGGADIDERISSAVAQGSSATINVVQDLLRRERM